MLKDISLGQYYPIDSAVHRLDPRTKLLAAIALIVLVFVVQTFWGFGVALLLIATAIACSRVPLKAVMRGLKPILFIVIFTFILNIFLIRGGDLLVKFWIFEIYQQGLQTALFMAVRIVLLVAGTSLLTLTTSPLSVTEGMERLLSPLKVIKFPAHEISMMMSIALRFIPTLAEEADRIMKAQAARGADFDTGGIIKKAKSLIPLLIPLFIGAFRRADELASAMEARCYNNGKGKTRLKVSKFGWGDLVAALAIVAAFVVVIVVHL